MISSRLSPIAWITFPGAFYSTHLVWVLIKVVLLGAREYGPGSDFIIFGIMLGGLFTGVTFLGYLLVGLPLFLALNLSTRTMTYSSAAAGITSYILIIGGYKVWIEKQVAHAFHSNSDYGLLGLVLLGALSALLVLAFCWVRKVVPNRVKITH